MEKGEKEQLVTSSILIIIFEVINEVLGDDVIVTTDVGQHQMWTAQKWPFRKPRTFITSGGLGTMGFGLGAAIGAQMGKPRKKSCAYQRRRQFPDESE